MLIPLSGILRDGTGTTLPTAQPLMIPQGVDCQFQVTITGQSANVIDISAATSTTMTLRIAQSPISPSIVLTGVLTSPTSGICTFTLPAVQSKGLPQPCYWYDVMLVLAGSKDEVVPTSTITFSYAVGA